MRAFGDEVVVEELLDGPELDPRRLLHGSGRWLCLPRGIQAGVRRRPRAEHRCQGSFAPVTDVDADALVANSVVPRAR